MRPVSEHVGALRDLERDGDVLLDEQDGGAALAEVLDGSQMTRGTTIGARPERMARPNMMSSGLPIGQRPDRDHLLLLAARKGACELARALGKPGEEAVDLVEPAAEAGGARGQHGAHLEVLETVMLEEHLSALGDPDNAEIADLV